MGSGTKRFSVDTNSPVRLFKGSKCLLTWEAGLCLPKCFTEVTRHSPSGNVDIKFPALCKHISKKGINKGDPLSRTKQKWKGGW